MRHVLLALAASSLIACDHEGSLVTIDRAAWINVGGTIERVYWCVAKYDDDPICYAPRIVPANYAPPTTKK